MKKTLTTLFALLLFYFFILSSINSQGCIPTNGCVGAPRICMQNYIGTTAGYSAGGEPINCPNGQQWGVHNDQWLSFIPTQSNIIINVEVVGNCSSGAGVQALIHTDCNSDPIDCDVDCGGDPSVGAGIDFIPGATYFLRIDGCSGAICPIKITYSPDGAIVTSPDPITPKWTETGLITGSSYIDCPGKSATFSAPLNVCATSYNWKVESGNAEILNDHGTEYTDNNPGVPGTDVTLTGPQRSIVRLKFTGQCPPVDTIRLSCEGVNGCFTTGKTYKTIIIKCPPDVNKKVKLCPNEEGWTDPDPFIGGPYPPGEPCGIPQIHTARLTDVNGCEFNLNLEVARLCEPQFINNLGQIPLCQGEEYTICGQKFDKTTSGIQTVTCVAKPKQNGNSIPPQCDSIKSFQIIGFDFDVKTDNPDTIFLACQNAKTLLSVSILEDSVLKSNGLLTSFYQWEYFDNGNWVAITGANYDTISVVTGGIYRFKLGGTVQYKDGLGVLKQRDCSKTSKKIVVKESSLLLDSSLTVVSPILVNKNGYKDCLGNRNDYIISNYDNTLKYGALISGGVLLRISKDTISVTWNTVGNQMIFLHAVAEKDGKCKSVDTVYKVEVSANPKVSCMASRSICGMLSKLVATNDIGVGRWKVIDKPIGSTVTLSEESNPQSLCRVSEVGVYKIRWEATNESCVSGCDIELTFYKKPPKIEDIKYTCNKTKSSYTVALKLNGRAPYRIMKNSTKGIIYGNMYISYPIAAGSSYAIKIMDSDNCDTLIQSGIYVCPGVIPREAIARKEQAKLIVFPNPAQEKVQLRWEGIPTQSVSRIELWDMTGKMVEAKTAVSEATSYEMNLTPLPSGNYVVRLVYAGGILQEKLLIVKE